MNVKARQRVERLIARRVVMEALRAGYTLGVYDGEETTLEHAATVQAVLKALFTTDDDYLLVYNKTGARIGWVRFVYGNDGYDVVSDYTVNLEHIMGGANKLADHYS